MIKFVHDPRMEKLPMEHRYPCDDAWAAMNGDALIGVELVDAPMTFGQHRIHVLHSRPEWTYPDVAGIPM